MPKWNEDKLSHKLSEESLSRGGVISCPVLHRLPPSLTIDPLRCWLWSPVCVCSGLGKAKYKPVGQTVRVVILRCSAVIQKYLTHTADGLFTVGSMAVTFPSGLKVAYWPFRSWHHHFLYFYLWITHLLCGEKYWSSVLCFKDMDMSIVDLIPSRSQQPNIHNPNTFDCNPKKQP